MSETYYLGVVSVFDLSERFIHSITMRAICSILEFVYGELRYLLDERHITSVTQV